MPRIHTSELPNYAESVRSVGGDFTHPDIVAKFYPIDLQFDAVVDQDLSPFSDEYFDQQIALYKEIAGRDLNQTDGELHPIDIAENLAAPNPLNILDVTHVAEHVRTVSSMLVLTALKGEPRILDMGAGHGLSSEIYAFSGCHVTAVDIDPLLSELARQRSLARNLPVTRVNISYDDLSSVESGRYEAAFFFQSLHHCIRPWDLIAQLKTKLTRDGVIAFAGEPVQSLWWRHWGLRLDAESLFVARAHGWFESGWSRDFISECFARNGMRLSFFDGGHGGGQIGIATLSDDRFHSIAINADRLGFSLMGNNHEISENAFATLVGLSTKLAGRTAFRSTGSAGVLLYGPYVSLPAGEYEVTTLLQCGGTDGEGLTLDIVSDLGETCHFIETIAFNEKKDAWLLNRRFRLDNPVSGLEIRAQITNGAWTISLPTIETVTAVEPY